MAQVFLLLGANLDNRFVQMEKAFNEIEKQIGEVTRYSSLYETAAWGKEDEPAYLNQVLLVETSLLPLEVLKEINGIENRLGRIRNLKWGSRTIDIDILFYDDEVIESERLMVPHPFLHQRKFALVPLNEIAPYLLHPVLKKRVSALLLEVEDDLLVRKIGD